MAMRLLSFVIWAVVAASAVFWLTRLLARSDPAPPHTVTANANVSASADLSRLLGSTRTAAAEPAAEPPADARFKLIGVVAHKSKQPDSGLALIAVDGKPPRPVVMGGVVDGELVLLAVNHRRAEIGPAGGVATVRLELPAVPEPNRSTRAAGLPGIPMPPQNVQPPQTVQPPQNVPPPQPATRQQPLLPQRPQGQAPNQSAPTPMPNRPIPAVTR
jgi:general secretion pathway protein C